MASRDHAPAAGFALDAPQPPPADSPLRISFHDGHIWHRMDKRWATLEPANPHTLLALYQKDACADDWFRPRARQLADELEAAMRAAGIIEHRSAA